MNESVCGLKLGMTVQDKVTGAVGTVTAKATYLYGVPQFLFEYRNTSGNICSSWFESSRFIVICEEEN